MALMAGAATINGRIRVGFKNILAGGAERGVLAVPKRVPHAFPPDAQACAHA